MVAPSPATDQRMAGVPAPVVPAPTALAAKCTTSPVRVRVDRGVTDSDRTGLATTVTATFAVAGPLRAMSRAWPGATPVTRPAASKVATAGASDVHSTSASARGSPLDVRGTAASLTPAPTAIGAVVGSMSMRATLGGLTVTVAKPGLPPITAPTLISPGKKNVADPFSSAAAESNGVANHAVGFRS